MNIKELDRGELVAVAGGILLGVSLFLSWYSLGNRNAVLGTCRGPNSMCTGWAALSALRQPLSRQSMTRCGRWESKFTTSLLRPT